MLDGFRVVGYRSFGGEGITVSDLAKINIFAGKNNCGKSNILAFANALAQLMRARATGDKNPFKFQPLDLCIGAGQNVTVGIQVKKGSAYEQIKNAFTNAFQQPIDESLWFEFDSLSNMQPTVESSRKWANMLRPFGDARLQALQQFIPNATAPRTTDLAQHIAEKIHAMINPLWEVYTIPAFRQITKGGQLMLSGQGLINSLRSLQNPVLEVRDDSLGRFAKIRDFVRTLLNEPSATLEIPADEPAIYVTIGGRTLPLESLGTGIHEVVILAAAVTLHDGGLFCIEEPEIHLHPELQKKFAVYVAEKTKNQYLIASHSNAFFDLPSINIYRCWLDSGFTKCELAVRASERHQVLQDLGYRPSDLLQSNFIVWVEGPSDRIYINRWIALKDPTLREGLHYSTMFYGGRLLSHLGYESQNDDEMRNFIELSRLNRNACMVMDSDRSAETDQLNETKTRIQAEFENHHCLVWITQGRTIENYLDEVLFTEAVTTVHSKSHFEAFGGEPFKDRTRLIGKARIDRIPVAHRVANMVNELSVLDLAERLTELVERIRSANGLPAIN